MKKYYVAIKILNYISYLFKSRCSVSTILQSPWSASPRNGEEAAKKSTTTVINIKINFMK